MKTIQECSNEGPCPLGKLDNSQVVKKKMMTSSPVPPAHFQNNLAQTTLGKGDLGSFK